MMKNNSKGSIDMKRAFGGSFRKTKRAITKIGAIPKELLSEIFARVASDSLIDIVNAKLSSKSLYDIAEDSYVYQHVSLDSFEIVPWTPITERQQVFLTKCEECDNHELLYRQAVVKYFSGEERESIISYLDKACKLGHTGAMYAKCIIMLFSNDEGMKEKGVKLLSNMKKNRCLRRELKVGRNKLIQVLRSIWVNYPLRRDRPIYCTRRDDHKKKWSWPDDDDEDVNCQACNADKEIGIISERFPRL